jgi:hypothetical protein
MGDSARAFGVVRAADPADPHFGPSAVQARLEILYDGQPVLTQVRARWDRSHRHVLFAVLAGESEEPAGPISVPHGLAVGARGLATEEELSRAFDRPDPVARQLLGSFCAMREEPDALVLLTGNDVSRTLIHAVGERAEAWSTKGLAGLAAVDRSAVLRPERVPELCLLDYVLLDDELVDGTTTLDEALVVRLDRDRVVTRSYWPLAERYAPGPPSSAQELRDALSADVARLSAVPGVHLGLTAGRDSVLVASCLLEHGLAMPAFTIGSPGYPDFDGASAVAAAWGTSHRSMVSGGPTDWFGAGPQWDRAVARSPWSEGMDTAWNLVGEGLAWDGPQPMIWLAGSGGEVGRAFYWPHVDPATPVTAEVLADQLLQEAREPWWPQEVLRERAVQACADALVLVPGWSALDVVYARGRLRKWLNRTSPREDMSGTVAAYTSPAVCDVLLRLPDAVKQSGSAFDEALALCPAGLRQVALQAVAQAHPLLPSPTPSRTFQHRVARKVDAVRRRVARPKLGPPLAPVLAQVRRSDAMPETWWSNQVRLAAHEPRMRQQLWAALSVEALVTSGRVKL